MNNHIRWVLWAIRDACVSLPQLKVYLYLLNHSEVARGFEPYCEITVADIARGCGLHERTVQSATAALQKEKFINIVAQRNKGGRSSNIYYLIRVPEGALVNQQ